MGKFVGKYYVKDRKYNYVTTLTKDGVSVDLELRDEKPIELDKVVRFALKQAIPYMDTPCDYIEVKENGKVIYSGEDKWFENFFSIDSFFQN